MSAASSARGRAPLGRSRLHRRCACSPVPSPLVRLAPLTTRNSARARMCVRRSMCFRCRRLISMLISLLPHAQAYEPVPVAGFRELVSSWCSGGSQRQSAEQRYGPIGEWDVRRVSYMQSLFSWQTSCNPPGIGNWDVSNVITMSGTLFLMHAAPRCTRVQSVSSANRLIVRCSLHPLAISRRHV